MLNTNGLSLSDIAAVTNNDGFGGNNGWWILIILFALFGGWGNGNWGANGGGVQNGYVLASDMANISRQIDASTASLERKGDNIINGLSNGFYTEAQLINGIDKSMMQNTNALTAQLNAMAATNAQCCCENKYLMAEQSCQTRQAVADAMARIMDNDNNNYRALDARITGLVMDAKDDKIATLTAQLNQANLLASQEAQSNYIVNQIKQCPVPAYVVANPYQSATCQSCCG